MLLARGDEVLVLGRSNIQMWRRWALSDVQLDITKKEGLTEACTVE